MFHLDFLNNRMLIAVIALCMALGRHMYRYAALNEHRSDMAVATRQWTRDSQQAAYDLAMGRARAAAGISEGQHAFENTCAACHDRNRQLVGPPVTEIARIYAGNTTGIVTWARAPGLPQMPAFPSIPDETLHAIADYMLEFGKEGP
ncbi:MAG: cytochrome c [Planctomycetes bacterium]|nr:cytochrome c [Planctomycetota bacterium]